MNSIDINKILDREKIVTNIKNILINFEKNKTDLTIKRGIYIYGTPGSGKTTFINNILKELNYDIISYDAGDIRNKVVIDTITTTKMSDTNIISLFNKKKKSIAMAIKDESIH